MGCPDGAVSGMTIQNRKVKIWIVSTCAMVGVFILYEMFGSAGAIKAPKTDYQSSNDANLYSADTNSGQIGPARVEYVEQARFETINPKTRRLERVIGFEKVLHKSGDQWELDKPYMSVYQENMRCDITSDTGFVELENLEGAKPTPKEAVLKGNVVVHIFGQGKRSDSFIYLNEVSFDNDRSMLWSKDDVNFVSAEANLLGKGLEIVYNSNTSRMEFLKIPKISYLNILEPTNEPQTVVQKTAKAEQTKSVADTNSSAVAVSEKPKEEKKEKEKKLLSADEDYRCIFRDNVRIEYKEEVILAEEVSVSNLRSSQSKNKDKAKAEEPKVAQSAEKSSAADTKAVEQSKSEKNTKKSELSSPAKTSGKNNVIATLRCDGPMIIRPMDAKEYEDWKPKKFRAFTELDKKLRNWLGVRNVLIAESVDYNAFGEIASTQGKVELVMYPEVESDTGKKKVPFVISAQRGAKFFIPKMQAVFDTDVKGMFVKQAVGYDEENTFYGKQLIADFAQEQDSEDMMASSGISHIAIVGPNVRLESVRTSGKTKLSHVRLKSERIDYDGITEDIVAVGKGKIEYSNTAKISRETSSQEKMSKPCYSLVEGFTKLVWDTNSTHVRATSEKTAGIHIGYLPITDTGYGPRTSIDTKQIDIDYNESAGKTQLTKLIASDGIVYQEKDGNEFAGKELTYNPAEEYMKIRGSDEVPCMLNGVLVKGIEYNVATGEASPVESVGVGVMPAGK
jgi:lipopolysaccharide export system protein LptA